MIVIPISSFVGTGMTTLTNDDFSENINDFVDLMPSNNHNVNILCARQVGID